MPHKIKGKDSLISALAGVYEVQKNHPRIVLYGPVQWSGKSTRTPGRCLNFECRMGTASEPVTAVQPNIHRKQYSSHAQELIFKGAGLGLQ